MAVKCGGGTLLASGIRTRERKERKLYSDDWALGDEEIEGHHTFNLDEKVSNTRFNLNFVKDMTNTDFTLSYIQKNGFNWPLLFKDKKNLGITIPEHNFSINDVRISVGSKRMLDVMDVNTQKNVEMTMKDWQRYYESQDKDKLLNVISLEFSHTRLETLVEAPSVVRQIDWVEKVWPRHLKEAQTESTNVLEDMMYPKVQKYCLMSVSGCYTDFHIDFGGTSVWYHILRGKKIFWLIPPSERNLQLYEQWVLSGKQSDIFFGDTVEKCARVELYAGDTFFIPTGWIHAVYTPDDSLIFGGNFLHSFGIEKQLRVASVEDTTHVPQKFRYPFFTEMLWYLLERYVHVLLGRTHLSLPPDEQGKYEKAEEKEKLLNKKKEHIHLTQYELHGLKAIVMFLHSLPTSKKSVPELIKDPIALIRDVRTVVEEHRYDSADLAVTNIPVLDWWDREPVTFTVKRLISDAVVYTKKRRQSRDEPRSSGTKLPPNAAKVRHRRVRCKECDACTRNDCRKCVFCRDMTRYGGQGTMKQTCKFKKCFQPNLPSACLCYICEKDGWMRYSTGAQIKMPPGEASSLYECSVCYKISHIKCTESKFPEEEGAVSEDYPNSWECPECIHLGYNQKNYKYSRVNSSRLSLAGSDANIKSPSILSETDEKVKNVKIEPLSEGSRTLSFDRKAQTSPGDVKSEVCESSDPPPSQMPTWEQLQARVSYPLVKPSWVVRPAPPVPETNGEEEDGSGEDERQRSVPPKAEVSSTHMKKAMVKVFSKLPKNDLLTVMRVCKQWAQWANDPSLWEYVSLGHKKVTESNLHWIVRRQPKVLCLDWSSTTYEQFLWLLPRLPQLSGLHCVGVSWGVLRPLISPYCPLLTSLDLSNCEGVDDNILCTLLKPPPFHRPGHRDTSSRLRQLAELKISGTEVGDTGIVAIVRSLPFLTHLDISNCPRVTHYAADHIANPTSLISHSLTNLDIRGCHRMSPMVLPALACLPILSTLAIDPCDQIPLRAIKVWGQSNGYKFDDDNIMTRTPPKKSIEDHMPSSDDDGDPDLISKKLKENCNKSKNNEENLKPRSVKDVLKNKTYHAEEKENYFDGNNTSNSSLSVASKETDSPKSDLVSETKRSSIVKQINSAEHENSAKRSICVKKYNFLINDSSTKHDGSKKLERSIQQASSEKKKLSDKLECSAKLNVSEKGSKSEKLDGSAQNEVCVREKEKTLKETSSSVKNGNSAEGVKSCNSSTNDKIFNETKAKEQGLSSTKKSFTNIGKKKEKNNISSENRKDKVTSSNIKIVEENVKVEAELSKYTTSEDDINCDNKKIMENESGVTFSPNAEGTLSESCRRSERSNKGSKYKIKSLEKKLLKDRKESEDGAEDAINLSEDSESEEKPKPLKKKILKRNSPPSVFKRKAKKKIITRSKNLRVEISKCSESDIENMKRHSEEKSSQLTVESGNQLKPCVISSKAGGMGTKYITKLRKKHKDGESSQVRPMKTQFDDEKLKKKIDEATSKKPKSSNENSLASKKDSDLASLSGKRRKERKGSSSSSSSSSSQSPLPSYHSEKLKKLKVELEPIGKLCRRRSEGHKISTIPPSVQSPVTPSPSGETSTPGGDKSSSRDRPERQHRSPRRLSMCQ